MDPERWQRAQDLFHDVVDRSAHERTAALDRACAGDDELRFLVDEMLANDIAAEDDLLRTEHHAPPTPLPTPPSAPGTRYGPYEAVETIGAGGMGEVLRGRRADGAFAKDVAIKLLRPGVGGPELEQRFLRERQTLARLDHESIARLLDGGTTEDGRPYLVMELVEGEHIDRYCDRRKLSVAERLRLFRRVCEAVEHAHERGVIHRDLKPGNILIREDGAPRLVDFGIARLADPPEGEALTATGGRLFTPDYASPEQVRGEEVTFAVDTYALGVVLYELLVGTRPFEAPSLHELERAVCEQEPMTVSRAATTSGDHATRESRAKARSRQPKTLRRELEGDLDAIVAQCLAKDPRRRYARVTDLMDDLRRHLAGRPIHARRPGWLERTGRAARRHPVAVLLTVAIAVAGVSAMLATRARDETAQTRVELLEQAAATIESARRLREQGQVQLGRDVVLDALETLDELGSVDDLPRGNFVRVDALRELAVGHLYDGMPHDAEPLLLEALPITATLGEDGAALRVSVLNNLAYVRSLLGRTEEARSTADEALAFAREHLPTGHELLTDSLRERANQHRRAREFAPSIGLLVEAVEMTSKARGAQSPGVASCLADIGLTLLESGDFVRAEETFERSLDILRRHFGESHPSVTQVLVNLGVTQVRLAKYDAAEETQRKVVELRTEIYGEDHGETAESLHFLGITLSAAGRVEDALPVLRRALAIREKVLDPSDPLVSRSVWSVAEVEDDLGNAEVSRPLLRRFIESGSVRALDPSFEASARERLAKHLMAEERFVEAEELLRVAYEVQIGRDGPFTVRAHSIRARLAQVYEALGTPEAMDAIHP